MKPIGVKISQPCSQNPDNFQKTKSGGFCHSCQNEVIDFRKMSKEETLDFIHQNPENSCGMFRNDHLSKISRPKKRSLGALWVITTLGFLGFSVPSFSQSLDQTKTEQGIPQKVISSKKTAENPSRLISGKIYSGDDKKPLPRAYVQIKGLDNWIEADMEGNFSFEVPEKFKRGKIELTVSFIGFLQITKKIKVKDLPQSLGNIYLPIDNTPLGPYGAIYPKKSKWGKLMALFGYDRTTKSNV